MGFFLRTRINKLILQFFIYDEEFGRGIPLPNFFINLKKFFLDRKEILANE